MSASGQSSLYKLRHRPPSDKLVDNGFKNLVVLLALMVAIILIGIFIVVGSQAAEAIKAFGLNFVLSSKWDPVRDTYGAFTAIYGTLLTSLLALVLAVPLGVGTAIFLTEDFINGKVREVISNMVELLAAIPSVVLGLWAIFVLEPFVRPILMAIHNVLGWIPFFSTVPSGPGVMPAVFILTIMLLPIITAISRDSLNQVPQDLRQAAYGIGATRWTSILRVLVPAAISGIIGGIMLALGRAMGETMAVTMIIGNQTSFNISWFAPGNTIASLIANQFGEAGELQMSALMYAALVLMIITFLVNVLAQWIVRRLALKYE
ncbi:ABC-type phosphate transport system permease component [Synechococcus sp. Minos11]|uniref:phosphate ABC transporter permease subunit PstC n=1 Tax=Synechococcus sp. Minos11 TaxID=221341 RepID=UPI001649603B|nr:phosphate ABC transporter permease subunit PstC [Synechococcus sp. Minos11]QNJ08934.1 ABC-type phosphate transport system permease component [Synechococcus sp. Minos11]